MLKSYNLVWVLIFMVSSAFGGNDHSKVVVVGGGIAGLTAAYRLQNAGVDVHLYEARNRVGGRIFTVNIDGRIAELGGHNIADGGDAVHMNRLIDELGLELTSSRVKLSHSYFDGKECTSYTELLKKEELNINIIRSELDRLVKTCSNMKEVLSEIIDENSPLYKTLAVRLSAYEGVPPEKLSSIYVETLYHMLLGGISSAHKGSGEGENYANLISIKEGNGLLPEKLASALGEKVHLNMPLRDVAKNPEGSFRLTFEGGQVVDADILVLAIPCSVYKKITFDGGIIPEEKLRAIRDVQYGTNAKIIVPFFKDPIRKGGIVNDEIVSFFDAGKTALTVYYTGPASVFSSDTISDAYKQARPMIEKAFGGDCPAFQPPIFAEDESFKSYAAPVGYSWPNDPYAGGSYSYIAPGQEVVLTDTTDEGDESFKTLFAPINGRLYFAGEHASILWEVPGTMEAASESGERVARAILKVKNHFP